MPKTERWFKLLDTIGIDAAGNPEPLAAGPSVAVPGPPTMKDGVIIRDAFMIEAKRLDGTRLFCTDDEQAANGFAAIVSAFEEIDPPDAKARKDALEVCRPHRARAERRNESLAAQAQKQHIPVEQLAEQPENAPENTEA